LPFYTWSYLQIFTHLNRPFGVCWSCRLFNPGSRQRAGQPFRSKEQSPLGSGKAFSSEDRARLTKHGAFPCLSPHMVGKIERTTALLVIGIRILTFGVGGGWKTPRNLGRKTVLGGPILEMDGHPWGNAS